MCYRKLANCFDRVTAGVDINAASNVLAMVLPLCLQRSEGDEPAANFIFACPCNAISVGVEAHGKLSYNPHTRCCGGPCPDYLSVVLQKQVVGAFIWSPVLGMLIWRRQYSLQMHWPARVHVENKVKSLCKEWLGISDNQWQVMWERREVAFPKLKSTTWNFHLRRRSFRNEFS